MSEESTSVLPFFEVIGGLIAGSGIGLAVGKQWEKGNQERKVMKEQLDKFEKGLLAVEEDPEMKKWVRENTPQLMKFLKLGVNNL